MTQSLAAATRISCSATTTVFLTIGSVSFGLWQEWWIDVGVLAAGLCLLYGRTFGPQSSV